MTHDKSSRAMVFKMINMMTWPQVQFDKESKMNNGMSDEFAADMLG